MPLVGSVCTGYGGIEMALREVLGTGRPEWVADNDAGVVKILQARYPGIPNLGDISAGVEWRSVTPVDILASGFPCTDLSCAGGRAGLHGQHSGVWVHVFRAIAEQRPSLVCLENVRGICSAKANSHLEYCPGCMGDRKDRIVRALGVVFGDLAGIGFDAEWCCVRACDIGAPHERKRIVILAWPAPDADDELLAADSRGVAARPAGGQRAAA